MSCQAKVKLLLLFVLVSPQSAFADDTSWHLLTKTYGGTVSLVKNLSQHECEFSRARMLGQPATDEERARVDKQQASAERTRQDYIQKHKGECVRIDGNQTNCPSSACSAITIDNQGRQVGESTSCIMTVMSTIDPGSIQTAECFQ